MFALTMLCCDNFMIRVQERNERSGRNRKQSGDAMFQAVTVTQVSVNTLAAVALKPSSSHDGKI